jgi:hypothetical protein
MVQNWHPLTIVDQSFTGIFCLLLALNRLTSLGVADSHALQDKDLRHSGMLNGKFKSYCMLPQNTL